MIIDSQSVIVSLTFSAILWLQQFGFTWIHFVHFSMTFFSGVEGGFSWGATLSHFGLNSRPGSKTAADAILTSVLHQEQSFFLPKPFSPVPHAFTWFCTDTYDVRTVAWSANEDSIRAGVRLFEPSGTIEHRLEVLTGSKRLFELFRVWHHCDVWNSGLDFCYLFVSNSWRDCVEVWYP